MQPEVWLALTPALSPRVRSLLRLWRTLTISRRSDCGSLFHEPSFGARPVPGRSGSDSLLVPEPSPSRRLHSDPLRAGTSRAPDAGGFRGARRDKTSERSLPGGEGECFIPLHRPFTE